MVGDAFVVLVSVVIRATMIVVFSFIVAIIVVGIAICTVYGSINILYIISPIIVCGNTNANCKILPNLLKLPPKTLHLTHRIIYLLINHAHRHLTRIQIETVVYTQMINHLLNNILLFLQSGVCWTILV